MVPLLQIQFPLFLEAVYPYPRVGAPSDHKLALLEVERHRRHGVRCLDLLDELPGPASAEEVGGLARRNAEHRLGRSVDGVELATTKRTLQSCSCRRLR